VGPRREGASPVRYRCRGMSIAIELDVAAIRDTVGAFAGLAKREHTARSGAPIRLGVASLATDTA
jgi:hypothetical protein